MGGRAISRPGNLLLCIALVASARSLDGSADAEGECRRELRESKLQWERERESLVEDRDAIARSCGAALKTVEENRKASDALIVEQKALVQSALGAIKVEREALRKERGALQRDREALRREEDAFVRQRDALLQEREGLIRSLLGSDATWSDLLGSDSEDTASGDGVPHGGGLLPAGSEQTIEGLGVGVETLLAALFGTTSLSPIMLEDLGQSEATSAEERACAARGNGHDNADLGDDEEAMALSRWARSVGITWGGWKFGDNGGGLRGAVVTSPMKKFSVLVAAPPSAVMSTKAGDDSPLPDTFIHPNVWKHRLASWLNIKLALRMIYEKRLGPQSSWAPYLATLPDKFSSFLWWSDEQLEELQIRSLIQKARNERSFYGSVAKRIAEGMPEPINLEEFMWGLAAVQSRSYAADFGAGGLFGLMCPVSDAVNHDDSSFVAMSWNKELGQLELRTPNSRDVGDNLYVSYGNYSNQRLLHFYGFVLEKNQFDYVPVFEKDILRAHGSNKDLGMKNRILRYLIHSNALGLTLPLAHLRDKSRVFHDVDDEELNFLGVGNAEMKMGGTHSEEDALVLYCRVIALDRKHLRMGALRIARRLQSMKPLSAANERAAVLLLIRVLQAQEAGMKTSLEEDAELLKTLVPGKEAAGAEHSEQEHYMNALRFRIQRKRLLRAGVQCLKERLSSARGALSAA